MLCQISPGFPASFPDILARPAEEGEREVLKCSDGPYPETFDLRRDIHPQESDGEILYGPEIRVAASRTEYSFRLTEDAEECVLLRGAFEMDDEIPVCERVIHRH